MIHMFNSPSSSYYPVLLVLHWSPQLRSVSHTCLAWSGRGSEEGQEHPSSAAKPDHGVGEQLCCLSRGCAELSLLIPPEKWAVKRGDDPLGDTQTTWHKSLSIPAWFCCLWGLAWLFPSHLLGL